MVGSTVTPTVEALTARLTALRSGARLPRVLVLEGPRPTADAVLAAFRAHLTDTVADFGWWHITHQRTNGDPLHHHVAELLPQLAAQALPLAAAVRRARSARGLAPAGADGVVRAENSEDAGRGNELVLPGATEVLRRWGVDGFPAHTTDADPLDLAAPTLGDVHRNAGAALAAVVHALADREVPAVVVLTEDALADPDAAPLLEALSTRRDLPVLTLALLDPASDSEAARAMRAREEAGTAQHIDLSADDADDVIDGGGGAGGDPRATTAPREESPVQTARPEDRALDPLAAARLLAAQYRYEEALALTDGLDLLDAASPDPDALTLRHERATWRGMAGRAREAAAAFERLAAEFTQSLGPTHPRTLAARVGISTWLGTAGDLDAALEVTRPLVADLVAHAPEHPATLETRALEVTWLARAGRTDDALARSAAIIADDARVLGPADPATLRIRDRHARLLADAGRPREALAAYEELAADRAGIDGPNDPAVLTLRANAAFLAGEVMGRAAAVAAYGALLDDETRVLGPDHAATRMTQDNLVAAVRGEAGGPNAGAGRPRRDPGDEGRGEEARLRAAVAERTDALGADHPDTLAARAELAGWWGSRGRATEALEAYRALAPDQERVLGPTHGEAERSRRNLVFLYERAGHYAEAAQVQERSLDAALLEYGSEDAEVLRARHDLAFLRAGAGETEAALEGMSSVLEDRRRLLGENHPDVLASRHNLAVVLGRAGRAHEAVEVLDALSADLERAHEPEDARTLATRASAAHWTARAGRTDEARARFDAVIPLVEASQGPGHPEAARRRALRAQLDEDAGA